MPNTEQSLPQPLHLAFLTCTPCALQDPVPYSQSTFCASGIYLRDLTYFEEGGSAAGEGLINFKKKKNVYSVIQIIQKYQQIPYTLKLNERYAYDDD